MEMSTFNNCLGHHPFKCCQPVSKLGLWQMSSVVPGCGINWFVLSWDTANWNHYKPTCFLRGRIIFQDHTVPATLTKITSQTIFPYQPSKCWQAAAELIKQASFPFRTPQFGQVVWNPPDMGSESEIEWVPNKDKLWQVAERMYRICYFKYININFYKYIFKYYNSNVSKYANYAFKPIETWKTHRKLGWLPPRTTSYLGKSRPTWSDLSIPDFLISSWSNQSWAEPTKPYKSPKCFFHDYPLLV